MPAEQPDVFLSYSSKDVAVAERVEEALKARKLDVYRDKSRLQAGQLFVSEIRRAIESSRAIAFLISPASNSSAWVNDEYQLAEVLSHERQGSAVLIPVLIGEAQPPGFLPIRQLVDLRLPAQFEAGINELERAIRGEARAPIAAAKLPPELRFLRFFPEGILPPLYRQMVSRMGNLRKAAKAEKGPLWRIVESGGVELVALDPKYLVQVDTAPAKSASKVLDLLFACFAEEDPFFGMDHVGRGRALLIRDLVAMAAAMDSDANEDQRDRILALARATLPILLDENEIRIGLEISIRLRGEFSPNDRDYAMHARFLLRVGQAATAADLLELYRGEQLFDGIGWSPRERIEAALDWASAVKAADRARQMHTGLVAAFKSMLTLADSLPAGDERSRLQADILNSRATQLAVFGSSDEWATAQADLDQALRLTQALHDKDGELTVRANQIAFTLDHLAPGRKPPRDLLKWMRDGDEGMEHASYPTRFFYLYQSARLLRRFPNRLEESERLYREASEIAAAAGLAHRAALAELWSLRLQKQLSLLAEDDFLKGLQRCIAVLEEHVGDAWSDNALRNALLELGRLLLNRHQPPLAWEVGLRAFALEVGRHPAETVGDPKACREIFAFLSKVQPDSVQRDQFLRRFSTQLRRLLQQKPSRLPLTWQEVEAFLK